MLIGEFQKNAVERVRVSLEEFRGFQFVDVRAYFEDKDGAWRPTRKGIAVPPDKVEELVALLRKAIEKISA